MAEEYFHEDYPKMLYHPDGRSPVLAATEEEEKARRSEGYMALAEYPAGFETCPAAPAGTPGGYRLEGFTAPPTRVQPQPAPAGATPSPGSEAPPPSRRRE